MLLEICANSYQSAKNARDAGVHRIELCQELSVGGITPSYGLLKQVVTNLNLSTFVLIRPRGGDFVYSEDEFDIMKQDIQLCKDLGCRGIVSGVLKTDKTIDLKRTKELIELSKPLEFTFHRAFDAIINPEEGVEQLIDLGVSRILTSGQETSAENGMNLLVKLHEISNNRLTILVGGGVTSANASKFKDLGFEEIHASASSTITAEDALFSLPLTFSDPIKIKAILNEL